jgi:hypothetical protein
MLLIVVEDGYYILELGDGASLAIQFIPIYNVIIYSPTSNSLRTAKGGGGGGLCKADGENPTRGARYCLP